MIVDNTEKRLMFTNGNIYTLSSKHCKTEAMAIVGDKICAIGTTNEIRRFAEGFREIDLKGKTVLPGFNDTHCHAISFGLNLKTWLGVHDTESVDEIKERVRERVGQVRRGEWVKGRGWCMGRFYERMPSRWDLDEVAPENPVVLIDSTGHIAVVNTKVLQIAGVEHGAKVNDGVWDAGLIEKDPNTGAPNGILRELLIYKLAWMKGSQPSEEEFEEAVKLYCKQAARVGITSFTTMMIPLPPSPDDERGIGYSPKEIKAFISLRRKNELPTRARLMVQAYQHWGKKDEHIFLDRLVGLGIISGFGDAVLEFGGIKIIADGNLKANTAAMREPFITLPAWNGVLHYTEDQLTPMILEANRNGLQVEIHAQGDRAVDVVLKSFERSLRRTSSSDMRNIITHVRVSHDDQIHKISELGLMVNGSPGVNGWEPSALALEIRNIGENRKNLLSRLRTMIDRGIMVAGGSDCHPCYPYGPIHWISRAVSKGNFSYEDPLTVDEAIQLWTKNAAVVSLCEDKKGSLECGKLADFVVLSDDPYKINRNSIDKIEVEKTFVGGVMVWDSTRDNG